MIAFTEYKSRVASWRGKCPAAAGPDGTRDPPLQRHLHQPYLSKLSRFAVNRWLAPALRKQTRLEGG
jgi:hypothetical protein